MKLAKLRTEELFNIHLEELRKEIGIDQKEWWFERKDQYASYRFLSKGVERFLKVLSNGAEQMNSVHKDARMEPLLTLLQSINEWNMSKFSVRNNKATQWINKNQKLTDYASEKHRKSLDEAFRRNVRFVQWNADHSEVIGNVSKVSSNFSAVDLSINVVDKQITCQCKFMEETGMMCLHAIALMAHEEEINWEETEWYEQIYHAQNYLNCYSVRL